MARRGIQLCYPFDEKRLAKWTPPYIVQPKLDGERCRALHTERGWLLLSSEENLFNHAVPHIVEDLEKTQLPVGTELDGELYHHDWTFESIHSVCGRTKNLHPDHKKIGYAIFDVVNNQPQLDRIVNLRTKISSSLDGSLYLVRTQLADTLEEVLSWYSAWRETGYEGIVVRHPDALYIRRRSTQVMKFKPKKSDTYTIVGFNEEISIHGEPKSRLGSFIVCPPGEAYATFQVGSGFTASQREAYWRHKEEMIFRKIKVSYQHKTEKGVPRFPVFVEVL